MPKTMLYAGCCNRAMPYFASANGKGIAAFEFNAATGDLTPAGVTGGIDNPTFLAVSPDRKTLYATSEVLGWNEGTISAYEINQSTGELAYINKQPSRGSILAMVSFDATGRFVFAANYGIGPVSERPNSALAVFPRAQSGELGPVTCEAAHQGSGKDPARQERPHAHCVRSSPDNRYVAAADLGLDRLFVYEFDAASGRLAFRSETALPPGSGPRHFVYHPRLPYAYVVNELNSTVASLACDRDTGRLTVLAVAETVPAEGLATNHCSEIALSPDGRFLFAGNRGHDSLSTFRIDEANGIARLVRTTASGGKTPRHFAIAPAGRHLAVANQDSDALAVFSFDAASGELTPPPRLTSTGTPTCVAFAELGG